MALLAIACAPVEPAPTGAEPTDAEARDGTLDGRVVDADGAPIAGATVVTDPRGYEAVTDGDGAFRIGRLLPGSYVVVVAADGFTPTGSDRVTVLAGAVASVEVALADAVTEPPQLRIEVTGPDGAPLAGATVEAAGTSGQTDALGVVTLNPGPGAVDVGVSHDRTWPRTVRGVEIPDRGGAQLALTLSGRPPAGSVVAGNGLCAGCHPDHVAATRHARAAALTADEPAVAFTEGWIADLGDGASARLEPGPAVVLVDATGAERSLPVAGWLGDPSRAAIPWTEWNGDPTPLPVAWVADDLARLPLAEAEAHLAPVEPGTWFTGGVARDPLPADSAAVRCLPCHVTGASATFRPDGGVDLATTWPYGPAGRFAEAGVGCEACHGPGSGHLAAALVDKAWTITRPDHLDPELQDAVCASCHSAYTSDAGVPWVPGFAPGDALAVTSTATSWPSGVARGPNQQSDELAASVHGDATAYPLGCLDCHDPHATALRAPVDDNTLCVGCHLRSSFQGDVAALDAHAGHPLQDPAAPTASGRCTGCHQPRTASRVGFGAQTGAGRLASHRFAATPPADAVAAFDAAGVDTLAPGLFPANPCQDCHAVASAMVGVSGPFGDPSLRQTHEVLQASYEGLFP